jgi:hypothetical protein
LGYLVPHLAAKQIQKGGTVMRLPIDSQHLNFIAVGIPEAVLDFDSKQPRHDPDGRALYSISIVAIGGEGADILIVKVAGLPKGITAGSSGRRTTFGTCFFGGLKIAPTFWKRRR